MRTLTMAALLYAALAAGAAGAQVPPGAETGITLDGTPDGPVTLEPGQAHRFQLDVAFTASGFACAGTGLMDVALTARSTGLAIELQPPTLVFVAERGSYIDGAPGGAYEATSTANVTIRVPSNATAGDRSYTIVASFSGTTGPQCTDLPPAEAQLVHEVRVDRGGSNGVPGPGALGVIAAVVVIVRLFPRP